MQYVLQARGQGAAVPWHAVLSVLLSLPQSPFERAPAGAAGSQHPQVSWQLDGREWHLLVKWCPGIISEQVFHRDTFDISTL